MSADLNAIVSELSHMAARLDGITDDLRELRHQPEPESKGPALELSWREKLWVVPAQTRIGVQEVAEALGRSPSWVYKRTGPGSREARLPCRKLDGELVFVVGEVRTWMREHEDVEYSLPMESTPAERRLYVHRDAA